MNRAFMVTRDQRGVTAVEFAIIAPVMVLMMLGLGDFTYRSYVQAILDGATQKAARDSAIQGGAQNAAAIDQKITFMVQKVAASATVTSTRRSYSSFSNVAPEPFVDANHNDRFDAGECFTDVNGNGSWDAAPGNSGQGGANDITVYTVTATYPRLFPIASFMGWSPSQTISSKTILKNQPYASQNVPAPATVC